MKKGYIQSEWQRAVALVTAPFTELKEAMARDFGAARADIQDLTSGNPLNDLKEAAAADLDAAHKDIAELTGRSPRLRG